MGTFLAIFSSCYENFPDNKNYSVFFYLNFIFRTNAYSQGMKTRDILCIHAQLMVKHAERQKQVVSGGSL